MASGIPRCFADYPVQGIANTWNLKLDIVCNEWRQSPGRIFAFYDQILFAAPLLIHATVQCPGDISGSQCADAGPKQIFGVRTHKRMNCSLKFYAD